MSPDTPPIGSEQAHAGFQVCPTPYGPPATALLGARVAALKGGDPLAPVTVIVASNYAAVSARRALAARPGGVANVAFLTLPRLAERLGASALAAAGRRPVSAPVLGQAVRAVLDSEAGIFAPVADHQATELALVAATRELAGVSGEALDALAAQGDRAAAVVRIAREVRARVASAWYDEADLFQAATEAVRHGASVGPVVVHLLQDLSPVGAGLLRALAADRVVWVDVGLTGAADADRPVLEAHARAGIAVEAVGVDRPVASKAVSVSDPDEEVRAAVRLVTGWMREGVALGRIALLYGTADPYARLLHEQLGAAGLPHNGAPVRAIGDMLAGRTLRRLLALGDRDFRRADVLGVVTGAPVRDGDRRAPGRAWERISRAAGVAGGGDWDARLGAFVAEQRRRADEAARTEHESLAAHLRADAERAEGLAVFVAGLRETLASVSSCGSWRAMAEAAGGLLARHLGGDGHRSAWPEEERQAAHRVEEALERLGGLDAVGGPPPSIEVFRRTLEVELDQALPRLGHLGEGVLVGPAALAGGVDLDRVVVLGMAEGLFPPHRLEDSLLSDEERRAAAGELTLCAERVAHDHRQLLVAVAGAAEATLCFPRGDLRRQGDRAASRWLLEDLAHLSGAEEVFTEDLAGLRGRFFESVPSLAGGLARVAFPATSQEHRLAGMLARQKAVIDTDPVLARGMALARARRSEAFTRFDGNLAGLSLPDYTAGSVTSASRLETWATCPHAFFMEYLLGVEPVEDPERQWEMSPLDRGSLIHEVLDRFVSDQIPAGRAGPWGEEERRHLLTIAEEVCAAYEARGLVGRTMFWRRDRARIMADLETFAGKDQGRPVDTELVFGDGGVAYPLADGRTVAVRGVIDRVDEAAPDRLTVIDYKTGSANPYKGLSVDDPHHGGTHLQLAIYGVAARQVLGGSDVEAWYWFVTTKGGFAWRGYPLTPAVEAEVGRTMAVIVDGIRAGVFPARPSADRPAPWVACWYCSPDGLHTTEVRRAWERKRGDPALAAYVSLVEPGAVDGH